MQKYFSIIICLLFGTLFHACTFIKAVRTINQDKVKPKYVSFQDKQLIIVPISHIGEKVFYRSLTDSIKQWKQNDYFIYYEKVKVSPEEMEVDSTIRDTLVRKWRRIQGGMTASRESHEESLKIFKKKVVQPTWPELGVDSTDVNADVTLREIIYEYEKLYEPIRLNECDWETEIEDDYYCSRRYPHNIKPIILDYRNQHVVTSVQQSPHQKIVVIYGALHVKGIKKLLTSAASS